jgi:hypothetical protein
MEYKCPKCGGIEQFTKIIDDQTCYFCLQCETTKANIRIADCYEQIIQVLKTFLDTTEENYKVMAIWIIGTYFHKEFNTYPFLFFNAMRGSGKTRGLKLVSSMGCKGDGSVQNNLTEAVLFRIESGTTTCIDEVEQIGSKDKQTLRELLNSAYKKGMKVKRMRKSKDEKGGEKQVVETFEPYFPICMANIWGMDEVLGDRSITLILEKSNNQAITKMIEDFDTNIDILNIKRTLEQVSDVSGVTLRKKTYKEAWNRYILHKYTTSSSSSLSSLTPLSSQQHILKDIELFELFEKIDKLGISGRNLELFMPLLLIAEHIKVLDSFLEVASKFTDRKKEDEYSESKDVSVYEFVESQYSFGSDFLYLKELTIKFRMFLGEQDNEDRWLNEKWFGRALKRLNLVIDSRKMSQGKQVTLNYEKAREKLKIFKKEVKDD